MDPFILCCSYLHWWPCSSDRLGTVLPPATPGACSSLSSVRLPPVWSAAAAPPLPRPAPSSLFQSGAGAERPAWPLPQERAASASLLPHQLCLLPGEGFGTSVAPQSPWTSWPGRLGGKGAETGQRSRQGGVRHGVLLWLCVYLRHSQWRRWLLLSEQRRMMKEGGVRTGNLCRSEAVQQWGGKGHRQRKKWVSLPQRLRSKLGKVHTHRKSRESRWLITACLTHCTSWASKGSLSLQSAAAHNTEPCQQPPLCTMHPTVAKRNTFQIQTCELTWHFCWVINEKQQ